MSKDLDNLRASIQLKADLDAVGKERLDRSMELLKKMPAHRIEQCVQYLEKNLIPAVKRKSGPTSPELAVFEECINLLQWSALLYARVDHQARESGLIQLEKQILAERLLLAEAELSKYQTVEDLYLTDARKHIEEGVRARLGIALNGKSGQIKPIK